MPGRLATLAEIGRRVIAIGEHLSALLASGGDARIRVRSGANTNVYGASPFPRSTLGYSASTANDISLDAFRHLERVVAGWPGGELPDAAAYGEALEDIRRRLKAIWHLDPDTEIVFAPSGTDLEFVALALAAAHARAPVTNILLGRDEVGSGCVMAAAGCYFADETAVVAATPKGQPVPGLGDTRLVNIPVRDAAGTPLDSRQVTAAMIDVAEETMRAGRHLLAHVVHGSKTGLVLPGSAETDALRARYGEGLTLVVDACQARVEGDRIREYLDSEAIVQLTGSKFMGGPPFAGFALVPKRYRLRQPLAEGMATIFRRAEWPRAWSECDGLPDEANPGLLLRLEAALFELERFSAVPAESRDRVIAEFIRAVRSLAARLGAGIVTPSLAGDTLHETTLATLDLSTLPVPVDFALAQRWWRVLSARGVRVGQPVRCVYGKDGSWAGTLRISLSMPLISELAELDQASLSARLAHDMARIADVLEPAQRPRARPLVSDRRQS